MLVWEVEVLDLLAIQQDVERVSHGQDPAGKFGAGATEAELVKCESALGMRLEERHRRFLTFANGWEGFSGGIDLFASSDFLGSERFRETQQFIHQIDDVILGSHARQRKLLVPIARSWVSTNMLVMKRGGGSFMPEVLWFENEPMDEFATFDDMFVTFKEYARGSLEFWRSQPK